MSDNHSIYNREGLLKAILATLAYFDVFSHPLTFEEILEFNRIPGCTREAVESALVDLMAYGLVRKNKSFFFLGLDETVVEQRIIANKLAQKRMHAAWFYSSLIARFPFIRAVMISGSPIEGSYGGRG